MTPETRGNHLRFEVLPKPPLPSASGENLPFAKLHSSRVNKPLDHRVRRPVLVAFPSSDEESSPSDPYEDLSSLGIIHSQLLAPRKQGARPSRIRKSAAKESTNPLAPPQQESKKTDSPSVHSSPNADKSSSSGKTSYYSAGPMYFQHHRQKSPSPTPSEQKEVERFEGVASFMHKPSSPPVWSSTTSNSLTDEGDPRSVWKHDRAWRAEQRRLGNMRAGDVRGGAEVNRLPPGYRRVDENARVRGNEKGEVEERLDEFMRSSSKLCEKLYTRMEALEGVVEVLLEGYKKISRRVGGLERSGKKGHPQMEAERRRQKLEMEELGEHLGVLNKAMKEGRMPKLEHVYHENDPRRRGSGGKAAGKRPVRR